MVYSQDAPGWCSFSMDMRRKSKGKDSASGIPPGNTQGMGAFGAAFKITYWMRKCWNHGSGSGILLPEHSLPWRFLHGIPSHSPSGWLDCIPFFSMELLKIERKKIPPELRFARGCSGIKSMSQKFLRHLRVLGEEKKRKGKREK